MHFRKCKMEWNSVGSYQTCGLRNPQGGALEGSLKEKRTATPSSAGGRCFHLDGSWSFFVAVPEKRDGIVELEVHLLLLCLIATKAIYYLVFFPRGNIILHSRPGLAMPGSSDCPEVNPSPPHDSGAALSPRLSASSSGRPL